MSFALSRLPVIVTAFDSTLSMLVNLAADLGAY
jgi:hypothetical protein